MASELRLNVHVLTVHLLQTMKVAGPPVLAAVLVKQSFQQSRFLPEVLALQVGLNAMMEQI